MKTRIAIQTLGCKLNQAESEGLARDLAHRGYQVVSHLESYDVCVVNTCTVTSLSDRKSRNLLRRARANNPAALLIAAGCYARTSEMQISGVGRGIVAHTHGIESLPDLLDARFGPVAGTGNGAYLGRTRSFVKIQEGCNRHCTYCVVPLARGEERSVDLETVLRQVRNRVAEGYQEIVLTGTNVGSYRSHGFGLTGLIGMILGRTAVSRLRISSLQPDDLSDDLLAAFQDPRLCPHIHMPLQSGSPGVLRRMGRRYTVEQFRDAFSLATHRIGDVALTTDTMVGFPGESDGEHNESLELCRDLGFAAVHVFPYSIRPGTPAARLAQVDSPTRKAREAEFLDVARTCRQRFHSRFIGRSMRVLWEGRADCTWVGLTENYIRVRARSQASVANTIIPARIERTAGDHVWGTIITGQPTP